MIIIGVEYWLVLIFYAYLFYRYKSKHFRKGDMMAGGRVYNVIATEEEIENINPKNIELWESFEMWLRNASRSPGTIKNYKSDIVNIFFAWLMKYQDNKYFGDIKPKDILLFQNHLTNELGMGNNRVRRIKDCLSSFSNYLIKFEDIPGFENVIMTVPSPKRIKKINNPSIFTDEDINLIFEGLINEYRYMDACALALAVYGGLRKADIPKVKRDWFTKKDIIADGVLYKSPEKITTKNDYNTYVYALKKECDRWLYLWKKEYKNLIKRQIFAEGSDEWLFISRKDGYWTQAGESTMTAVQAHINKILKAEGIEKEFIWEEARKYYDGYVDRTVKDKKLAKMLKKNMVKK